MFCTNKNCLDYLETGFHAEFVDGVTKCPRCGEYLVYSVPEEEPDTAQPNHHDMRGDIGCCRDPLEPVFETEDPSEINEIEALFLTHGIPSQTRVKSLVDPPRKARGMEFEPMEEPVVFLVPRSLADRAWELLADYDDSP